MKKLILVFITSSLFFNCSSDGDDVIQNLFIEEPLELPIVNNEFDCECTAPEAISPTSNDMVFEGTIRLQTQAQVEIFGAENYTYITGNLIIRNSAFRYSNRYY